MNNYNMQTALQLLADAREAEAERMFKELAAQGNVEAKFTLAGMYMTGIGPVAANHDKCINLLKDAADNDNYEPAAALLSSIYYEGIGTRVNFAESAFYAKKVTNDETDDVEGWKGFVYNILGKMSFSGNGVTKNVPKAYHLFKYALGIGCEEAMDNIQKLTSRYPMLDDESINLKAKGRSKWATFFLVLGLLYNIMVAIAMCKLDDEPHITQAIVAGVCAVVLFANLAWVKFSVIGLVAMFLAGFCGPVYMLGGTTTNEDFATIIMVTLLCANGCGAFITLFAYQKRKDGCALPVNTLMGWKDDGRNQIEFATTNILAYGEGAQYKTDSAQTRTVEMLNWAISIAVFCCSCYAAWQMAHIDMSTNIEWNCFKSPQLYGFLCVVGFFLQFFNWTHLSFITIIKWKDQYGNEHQERDRDMMTEIEGGFLWPLIGHFVIAPMLYGAMLYYIIMGGFALLQGIMPWVLGVLLIASVTLPFRWAASLVDRKYRFLLVPLMGIMAFGFYFVVAKICESAI